MEKIVITGGSGMLGRALLARLADTCDVTAISRSEKAQLPLRAQYPHVAFEIGDIRDRSLLDRVLRGAQVVIHGAALKHVPLSEAHPGEYISVNVQGSRTVLEAAQAAGARVIGISTDKACAPLNVYGASKFLMERMLVEQDQIAIRYGNVFGSDGSVIVRWQQQLAESGEITVTDSDMTRFFFRIDDAVDEILWAWKWRSVTKASVVVPNLRAVRLGDLADAVIAHAGRGKVREIGPRDGEKAHEALISADEGHYAAPCLGRFLLHPLHRQRNENEFPYPAVTSDRAERIPREELIAWLG